MKQHRKILWVSIGIISILIISISGLLLMFSLKSSSAKKQVVTYTIRSQPDKIFQGVVIPKQESSENLDTNLGTLVSINVKDGQPVKIGDNLLTYTANNTDMISLQYAVKNAQLALSNAQETLNNTSIRLSKLQKQYTEAVAAQKKAQEESSDVTADPQSIQAQIDSENQAIEQSNQTIKSNELALEEAQTNLNQAQNSQTIIVKAKQEGIAFVGDINTTARPLVQILSKDTLIRAQVSEFEYDQIKQGASVKVRTMNLKRTTEGMISLLSTVPVSASTPESPENTTHTTAYYTFVVKPKENLQYGYNVQVIIPNGDLLIPKTAVKDGMVQLEQKDGTFKSVRVETQPKNGQLQVVSGLKVGDKIAQGEKSHD